MPARYVRMRDKFIREGASEGEAKTRAAQLYNAWAKKHNRTPVTRNYEKTRARKASG